MSKIKYLATPFIFLLFISASITIANSQNDEPFFSVQSVSSRKIPVTELYNSSYSSSISGNILYLLNINATLDFPHDTYFSGDLIIGCGIGAQLVIQTDWKVLTGFSCPDVNLNVLKLAGTYKLQLPIYVNSIYNYSDSNYPKIISLYIFASINNPHYRSDNFTVNLAQNPIYFNQSQSGINYNDLLAFVISIVFFFSGIFTIVEYRKFRKEKVLNTANSSFRIFLKDKIRKKKQISHQKLSDKTMQKLEEIIEENST